MNSTRRTWITVGVAASLVLGTSGSAVAMSGGTPVTDPQIGRWVATLALPGEAPLLQRAGCGGALIAPDRVLTAAHRVDRTDPSRTEVHVGARVLSAEPGEVRGIEPALAGSSLACQVTAGNIGGYTTVRSDPVTVG